MSEIEYKIEYHGDAEIAKRLRCGVKKVQRLREQDEDPLPCVPVGREWWITEESIRVWLNRRATRLYGSSENHVNDFI